MVQTRAFHGIPLVRAHSSSATDCTAHRTYCTGFIAADKGLTSGALLLLPLPASRRPCLLLSRAVLSATIAYQL
jgi:hypothetical protein